MTPFYSEAGITIYLGSCVDVLPTLSQVDHVITDPPYAEATHTGARTHAKAGTPDPSGKRKLIGKGEKFITFDSVGIDDLRSTFDLLGPLVRRWCISFMEWRYIGPLENLPPAGLRFVRFGVWVKPNSAPQFTGDRPGTGWEAIGVWHRLGGRMKWNGGGRVAVWSYNTSFSGPAGYERLHPTQKPLVLVSKLVEQFTDVGDLILDPFAGSGTTALACKNLGRRCILIEQNEAYCEIAANRLQQEVFAL